MNGFWLFLSGWLMRSACQCVEDESYGAAAFLAILSIGSFAYAWLNGGAA